MKNSPMRLSLCLLAFLLVLPQCSSKSRDEYIAEGLVQMERNLVMDARQSFLQAIEADPNHAEGYYHLGSVYNVQKRYEEAVEQFKTALRLDPTHYDAHFSLGYAYEQSGQKELAEEEYETFRRLKKMSQRLEKKRQGAS